MDQERCLRFYTIPNLISMFRILLIIPIAYFVWHDNLKVVFILILIGVVTDYMDGIIARHFNQISDWGKLLDPLADKLAIGTLLIILHLKQEVPLWLVIVVVGRDLAILIAGLFLAKKYRLITTSNFIGKCTANVLTAMVISYIFDIDILQTILTPLGVFFVGLSSLSYFLNFLKFIFQEKAKMQKVA